MEETAKVEAMMVTLVADPVVTVVKETRDIQAVDPEIKETRALKDTPLEGQAKAVLA